MLIRFVPVVLGLIAASPLAAQASSPAAQVTPAAAPGDKKVCRRVEVTGSMMPERVCRTRAQWAAVNDARVDNFYNARDRMKSAIPTNLRD